MRRVQPPPLHISKKVLAYFGLSVVFFGLSFSTIYFVHRLSGNRWRLPVQLFSGRVLVSLAVLLLLYYLADGFRLYCVIRAMGFRIGFLYILKLVFINIFVSNVTPLATGGGVVQVYFMRQKGMPIGEATAATSIRTMLAALMLFTLAPLILWTEPNQFRVFFHGNLLYGITAVSAGYLLVAWSLVYRIGGFKRLLLFVLNLLVRLKVVTRSRSRRVFLKLSPELSLFSDGFKRYLGLGVLWPALSVAATAAFLTLLFSFSVVLVAALGYSEPVLTVFAFQIVVTFFMYFAPTPGAAGVAEGGYGLLFARLVERQDITALTLSWRFLTIYIGMIIGIIILYKEVFNRGRSIRKWRRSED